MNIFITGISGFVGSHLARHLIPEHNVVGLSRTADGPKGARVFRGDICDYDLVRSILSSCEIDLVYHLAASAIVQSAAKDPMTCYKVNTMGTVTLLEAVRVVDPHIRVVVASSDKAYGDTPPPYTETSPLRPSNTYDASKAAGDMAALACMDNYGMHIAVTRASNIYGPGDPNQTRIIPRTISRLLRGLPPVLYEGAGEMMREFVYIDDIVKAYVKLGTLYSHFNGPINLGTGHPIAIKDLVAQMVQMCGGPDPVIMPRMDKRFREIQKQWIKPCGRAREIDWQNTITLQTGLRRCFADMASR